MTLHPDAVIAESGTLVDIFNNELTDREQGTLYCVIWYAAMQTNCVLLGSVTYKRIQGRSEMPMKKVFDKHLDVLKEHGFLLPTINNAKDDNLYILDPDFVIKGNEGMVLGAFERMTTG